MKLTQIRMDRACELLKIGSETPRIGYHVTIDSVRQPGEILAPVGSGKVVDTAVRAQLKSGAKVVVTTAAYNWKPKPKLNGSKGSALMAAIVEQEIGTISDTEIEEEETVEDESDQ